jgi:hypothetical protein
VISDDDAGFLSRWSRRKAESRRGHSPLPEGADLDPAPGTGPAAGPAVLPVPVTEAVRPAALRPSEVAGTELDSSDPSSATEPLPTLADVAQLTRDSDFSRFVAPGIDEGVKQAAMKKLFSDPHFNVMDGLDTYIADYNKPDPIPLSMLRQMTQSKALRLFDLDEEGADDLAVAADSRPSRPLTNAAPPDSESTPDDDADLQLQQDHALGRPEPGQGAGA